MNATVRRMWCQRLVVAATLLVTTRASAQQAVDGFDAHGFVLAAHDVDPRDLLVLRRPGDFTQGDFFAAALVEYAKSPLRLVQPTVNGDPERTPVVDNVLALNISAGVAAHERVRFDVAAPLYFLSNGLDLRSLGADPALRGPAMGDIRATSMVMAVLPGSIPSADGLGLAFLAHLDLPSGAENRMLGRRTVGGGAGLSGTYEVDRYTISAETTAQFDPSIDNLNILGGTAFSGILGFGVLATDEIGANFELASRVPFKPPAEVPLGAELIGSLRYLPTDDGRYLTFGTAAGLTNGPGVATFRLFVGGGFGQHEEAPTLVVEVPPDPATVPLTIEATYQGEPRAASLSITGPSGTQERETNAGGTTLQVDPETVWEVAAVSGACLAGENRGMATLPSTNIVVELQPRLDAHVRVEVVGSNEQPIPGANVVWTSGTPECIPPGMNQVDADGALEQDIAAGNHHLTVTAPAHTIHQSDVTFGAGGNKTVRVQLQPTLVEITRDEIKVLEKVHFDTAKAIIKPESYQLLKDVAGAILSTPDMGRIEVAGHTDSRGSETYNQGLSQSRAESVRDFLIAEGVPAEQLIARGYGETRPIDTNNTASGREANRRVQFTRLDAQGQE